MQACRRWHWGLSVALIAAASPVLLASPAHAATGTPPPVLNASASSVVETSGDGGVGFAVGGTGWYAAETITLTSPGLMNACGPNDVGWLEAGSPTFTMGNLTVPTDFSGAFNVSLLAIQCAPGTFQIQATESDTPNRVATTEVTVAAPQVDQAGMQLSPASETETGVGTIATTIMVTGLAPQEVIHVTSPSLLIACKTVDAYGADSNLTGALPYYDVTDLAGNDLFSITATGCNLGSYPVSVTEDQGARSEFDENFSIAGP
jgi:hypothetical protein